MRTRRVISSKRYFVSNYLIVYIKFVPIKTIFYFSSVDFPFHQTQDKIIWSGNRYRPKAFLGQKSNVNSLFDCCYQYQRGSSADCYASAVRIARTWVKAKWYQIEIFNLKITRGRWPGCFVHGFENKTISREKQTGQQHYHAQCSLWRLTFVFF